MNTEEDRNAIEATITNYWAALNASDVEGVLALYTEDGVFIATEGPTVVGKRLIRAAYEQIFDTIKPDIAFTMDEIVQIGNFAFARTFSMGEVTVLVGDLTLPEKHREYFVLEKTGDEWKIAQFLFNKMDPQRPVPM